MTTQSTDDVQHQKKSSVYSDKVATAVANFIKVYDARASFFSDDFIDKVKSGKRKALLEIAKYPMPATYMDLRNEFARCIHANVPDDQIFKMRDGKAYSMMQLKTLVIEWALLAERALISSDPAMADKLMSRSQWDAKSAFEVTFVSAMNELKDIRKTKLVQGSFDHYSKWIITPMEKAAEQVKAVNTPRNALIGFGDKLSLEEALVIAEKLRKEFSKVFERR